MTNVTGTTHTAARPSKISYESRRTEEYASTPPSPRFQLPQDVVNISATFDDGTVQAIAPASRGPEIHDKDTNIV